MRKCAELVCPAPPTPAAYPPGAGPLETPEPPLPPEPPDPPDPEPPPEDPVPDPDAELECDVAQAVKKTATANSTSAVRTLNETRRDMMGPLICPKLS